MKINNFIAAAVAATLALTSCESRQEQYEQDLLDACNVKIMSDNYVKTTAISSCTGLDTSWTVDFGVAYAVNIANLPGIDDVRYDEYEFYAMLDGRRSEEHTSELQSRLHLVCRLLLENKNNLVRCLAPGKRE